MSNSTKEDLTQRRKGAKNAKGRKKREDPSSPSPSSFASFAYLRELCESLFGIAVLAVLFCGCGQKAPVIHYVEPKIGNLGEPLIVHGGNFGVERGESFVTVAGARPTGSSYQYWQDDKIIFKVPEFGESGLVYVHVAGKKSNAALFADRLRLPHRTGEGETGVGPKITSVNPREGPVGTLLEITGTGFGGSRGGGGVFFSWAAETRASSPAAWVPEFIETSETEFGYEMWSEREIRVRVPDGASGGNIQIRTARGGSPPVLFTVADKPGTKIFRDKRTYTLSATVHIKTGGAETPNSLYLWVPRPATSASQRNVELLESVPMPFMGDYRGTGIYKLENLAANSESTVDVSWKVDVYRVETSVLPQQIRQNPSPVNAAYTQSNALIPSDDQRIKNRAAQITGRERNPYLKARVIYEWLLKEIAISEDSVDPDIFTALETGRAGPYTAALLYCALLRSAGVPALPVAGVLVSRGSQTVNHYWAEFWADGLGWIPADPAMAAGAVPAAFQTGEAGENFYFGNTDNQRIAFSRGFAGLSPLTPGGRTVSREHSYALQSLWEEASGGLDYTSEWGEITIVGSW